ncbi:LacI family DNA-binding transcriptional regulator [Cohaesibacter celericrescens]|uniref:LacI family transcriptional regulator n=1 Tax=Cohaesibacter celericrescens TaxID=2067669 RepID=A0A2N5XK41_9HYPH|nr:LacI family DNA-binding transcriptional regulator [Cohaesibacter celericrescens]PLW74844.1 LacI family transcriptional regulator [Cohaesibacter celericrescens]
MELDIKKTATLRHVAELAGVSASTASLVLNRKGDISEATRNRVLQAMEQLNYVPRDPRAKSEALSPDAQNTVRFLKIARHGQTVNLDHNIFISDYIDGMSSEATRRDYSLQVVTHENESIGSIVEGLIGADLRGIIALGTELSDEDLQTILDCGLPNVIIDTHRPFMKGNFIDMDNNQLVCSALEYLKNQNFSRIGLVGSYSSVMNFKLRQDAFRRSMKALGLPVDPAYLLSVASTIDGAYSDSVKQLADSSDIAEAYLCANDVIAFGFIRALRERGLSVPNDVSVIGIDNLHMAAAFDPPLTSLNFSKKRIGAMAVRILDDLIAIDEPQPPVKVLVSGELVLRDSVKELPKVNKRS